MKINILFPTHFGFRGEVSTEQADLTILEDLNKNRDELNIVIHLTLNLSKTFDTINHDILPHWLLNRGITDPSLNMFYSYISCRTHYVRNYKK